MSATSLDSSFQRFYIFIPFDYMVGVAQSVEHMVVAHVAVGSSPIAHPIVAVRPGSCSL